jgi:hypothetical protein
MIQSRLRAARRSAAEAGANLRLVELESQRTPANHVERGHGHRRVAS